MRLLCVVCVLLLSSGVMGQQDLYVAGLFPFTGQWNGGRAMEAAAEIALETINNNPNVLDGYRLNIISNNTDFEVLEGVRLTNWHLTNAPTKVAIFGAANSEGSVALSYVAYPWNILQISYVNVSPLLSNKVKHPHYFRTSSPDTEVNPGRVQLMKEFGWKKAAIIFQDVDKFSATMEHLRGLIEAEGFEVIAYQGYPDSDPIDPTQHLQYLKDAGARLIFNLQTTGVDIFCKAYKMGMTGPDYVWVYSALFSEKWWLTSNRPAGCTDEEMNEAAEGVIVIGDVHFNPTGEESVSGLTPTQLKNEYNTRVNNEVLFAAHLIGQCHDAMWALALALDATETQLKTMGSKRLSDYTYEDAEMAAMIRANMLELDFIGTKSRIRFNQNQDPIITGFVERVQSGERVRLGLYYPNPSDGKHFVWNNPDNPVAWEDDKIPADSVGATTPNPCNGATQHTGVGLALLLTTAILYLGL